MFTSLLKLFLQIILLRKGPQDLPYSPFLLLLLLGCVTGLWLLAMFLPSENIAHIPAANRILFVLAVMLVNVGGIYVLLRLFHFGARVVQTLTAMLGASLILSLIHQMLYVAVIATGGNSGLLTVVGIFIIVWSLIIDAYILRQALSISLLVAGLLAYSFFLAELALRSYFGFMGS